MELSAIVSNINQLK